MAAVVAIKAKEAGIPKLRFQALLWPVTDANFNNSSYNQFAEGHFLTRNMMEWFWDSYTTDPKQRDDIHASPLRASLDQLKGLPPALVQTAEMDVLRAELSNFFLQQNEPGQLGGPSRTRAHILIVPISFYVSAKPRKRTGGRRLP